MFVYVNRCRSELNELLSVCQVCLFVCIVMGGMWMVYCVCVCM